MNESVAHRRTIRSRTPQLEDRPHGRGTDGSDRIIWSLNHSRNGRPRGSSWCVEDARNLTSREGYGAWQILRAWSSSVYRGLAFEVRSDVAIRSASR